MKISEMLRLAQYSRIEIGNRWLTVSGKGWKVLKPQKGNINGKVIIDTDSEDEAVAELLKGEPLYSDILIKAKAEAKKKKKFF